ncbi:MAG: type II toxin-antitoxin system death-on-curing family toxin [Chthoniobacterales bacterium]
MTEPDWLSVEECLIAHEILVVRFGGTHGLRDAGLLDSALNKPRQLFCYGSPTLYEMAAAYAFGIVKNHPFLDGNKRAGFIAASLFLESNGLRFTAPEEEAVLFTRGLAAGEVTIEEYTLWLRKSSQPA